MGEKTEKVKDQGKKFFEKMFVPAAAANAPAAVPAHGHGKKPGAGAGAKPAAKPNAKPATKPAAKPATKPATKPKPNAKPVASKKLGFTDKQAKYEDVPWSKLPLSARKAAKAIGYDQQNWDDAEWLHIDDKHWRDLTPEEKKECETLGWDEVSWESKYENQWWADMPNHVQKAAEKLGWNQENWDEDWDTPTWHKGWKEFSVVKHLDGREIAIKSKPGEVIKPEASASHPFVKIVPNEGMPSHGNPFVKGNLYVLFRVEFPSDGDLTKKAVFQLKKLLPSPAMDISYDQEEVEVAHLEHGDVKNFGKGGATGHDNNYDSDDEEGPGQVQCQQS